MRKLLAVRWFGGKYSHLDFLLEHLPKDAKHFVDVYGGSAAVILNAGPYNIETYNDLDSSVVTFFRVLRDAPDEIIRELELTPYSREEFIKACDVGDDASDLEVARAFYIRAMQSYVARSQGTTKGMWSFSNSRFRIGLSDVISRWLNHVNRLPEIVHRFKRIQIENRFALDVIKKYDTEGTLFYVDPPYVLDSRKNSSGAYGPYEMDDNDHKQLAETLGGIKGRAVVSGYKSELYDTIFKDWNRIDEPMKFSQAAKDYRQEVIWKNF